MIVVLCEKEKRREERVHYIHVGLGRGRDRKVMQKRIGAKTNM